MQEFFEEFGVYIIVGIYVILEVILLILRKKKIIVEDSLLNGIYMYAIDLIKIAESKYKIGADKKEFVINGLKEKYPSLSSQFDESLKTAWKSEGSSDVYSHIVEEILSTPQKKDQKK